MKTTTTTKVQSTQEVNTSYGYKNCCKGKLILIPTDKQLEAGLLAQSKSIHNRFTILNHATVEAFKNDPNCGWQVIDPIIISETEVIEFGDYHLELPTLKVEERISGSYNNEYYKKVLALPENISPKQLQAIADGKLKGGQKVLVGCVKIHNTHGSTKKELESNDSVSYQIETDLKDYITLYKAEQETWDDIYKRINTVEFNSKIEVFNFLKKHYQSPKRIQ